MKTEGIKKNFIFQGLYQALMLIIPLVVSPYLTRTLGSNALGVYAYTNSIAYYFVLASMLGISRYGQRTIAQHSTNLESLRKEFWSLFVLHVIISLISSFLFLVFVFFRREHQVIFYYQFFYVLSAAFDITWFFYGIENFRNVVIKNSLVKALELVCIFCLIHSDNDLDCYTLIMSCSVLFGQLIMIPQMLSIVKPTKFRIEDILKHIKPLFLLSISVFAVSLYTVFDKTLLGLLSSMSDVSFYEYSNKLIGVPKVLLGVIPTVLFPRVCRIVENNDSDLLKRYFNISFELTIAIGMGATVILAGVAKTFAPLYYGSDFSICGSIMIAMSPVILIVSLGDLIRTQLMISKKRDREFVICVVINAVVNVFLSLILIRAIGIYGAVVGSLAAEVCGLCMESWYCKKDFSVLKSFVLLIPYFVIGITSFIPMFTIYRLLPPSWETFLFEILAGTIVYLLGVFLYYIVKKPESYEVIIGRLR